MKTARVISVLWCLGSVVGFSQQYTISTFAGGGPQAPAPNILSVGAITTDAAGNVYFSSTYFNACVCVFKLDTHGTLTRLAGGPQKGFSGDGGPASKAQLNNPTGLAVDGAGNVFIAETVFYNIYFGLGGGDPIITADGGYRERVRKISTNGIITTVAGGGDPGFSGDGGPATGASFFGMNSIAVDAAGNLYIADGMWEDADGDVYGNNRIRKVTPDGIITTIAGDGKFGFSGDGGPAVSAQLYGPQSLTVDGAGNLVFSDIFNRRIRQISVDGTISTVVDLAAQVPDCTAPPNSYWYCSAYSLSQDPSGNLVFGIIFGGNFLGRDLVKRSGDGTVVTFAGNQLTYEIGLQGAVALDAAGNLWFSAGNGLRKLSPDGIVSVVAGYDACCGGGDGGPASKSQLLHSNSVATDLAGNVYIADTENHRIRQVNAGGTIATVAGNGAFTIDCDAATAGSSAPATAAQLCWPSQVAADGFGNVFVVDRNRIRKVSPDGTITSIAGDGTAGTDGDGGPAALARVAYPNSVAVDATGNLYFAEYARVRKIAPDGMITTVAGTGDRPNANGCYPPGTPGCGGLPALGDGGPAIQAQLLSPANVNVDAAGNIYFTDGWRRVRKVSPDGTITTVAGNSGSTGYKGPTGDGGPATDAPLWNTNGLTVDAAGNLYISEPVRVRKVTTDGIINTIAGTQDPGYTGDGGPATQGQLWNPTGLAVDGSGNVYVADSLNNVIRVLKPR